jgi:ABC-2 type transport system permease protein
MSAYLGMPQSLVKARENGVLEAYRVAGIPSWSLPLATIIISFIHMMIVATVVLFSAPYIFDAGWPSSKLLHILTIAIVAICSESLGALLSCMVKKQATLTLVGQLLFLPTVMFSGIMFPAKLLPKPMRYLGEILPATQGMKLFTGESLHLPALAVLLSMTLIAFTVSVILYRKISVKA